MQKSLLFTLLLFHFFSKASHNRSGEITYKRVAPFTKLVNGTSYQAYWYEITVTKYTDDDTPLLSSSTNTHVVDRCVDTLYFGDNTKNSLERINGGLTVCQGCKPCGCAHCGELLIDDNGYRVKKNIWKFLHEYQGPGTYTIRTSDPNRNAGVFNMFYSEQQLFYLQSSLVISSFSGSNNSPEFTVDPIDKACLNKCFTHNPGAYDSDHDSLSYKMSTPKGANGITVSGYSDPTVPPGGTFNINDQSGTLTWCSPQNMGEYNIAFVVEEWRRNTSGKPQLIGTVLRDMQIVVRACLNNDPPLIVVPQDTCVEAGTLLQKNIYVSDLNVSNVVTLAGSGGAFAATAPVAQLSNTSGNGFNASFTWQTSCEHISNQYYKSTFKAEDNGGAYKLANFAVYNVKVVPPQVKGLTATPQGTHIKLDWTASCNPHTNPLIAYRVYRQEGCAPFVYEPCRTGIPGLSSFVYLGESENVSSSFLDNNNGEGLIVGQDYSYLVIAVYQDRSMSFAGTPVCTKLKRDVPILLNVDVLSTSPNGSVDLRWARPLKTAGNFDTLMFPGPYRFELKYKSAGVFSTIFTSTANNLSVLDTAFIHTSVNTTRDSCEYLVAFSAGEKAMGSSNKATSVFLSVKASDRRADLSWKSKTPWKNYSYAVYRKDPGGSNFTSIGTTTGTSFSDSNSLINKKTYCYYVASAGEYSDPTVYKPLLNKSQQVCVTPVDLTPPCTPTLSIEADCPTGFVTVNWKNVRAFCSDDVISYLLFYKNTVSDTYQKVLETDTTFYVYDGLTSISGCYAIQAVDSAGNVSKLSPDFCIENCPEFELPNIFSPNKDGSNDYFKAVKVRQIKEIDLVIMDRWGNTVYSTKDPYFQWDGTNVQSKQMVSDGTFLYVCTVYEPRIKGTVKRILKGTVQVVR